jgi:hypothetical protein
MKFTVLKSLILVTALAGAVVAAEVESRPWLGVMLSPVSGATARQLALEADTGIMVTNIAKDSPAADAGLEQYDVIVELNGQPVSNDFGVFSEEIVAIGVGGKANLAVIRGGERVNVVAALGEMPPAEEIEYLHESEPNVVTQLDRDVFGKILEKDDDGNWVMRDLGELDDMHQFFGNAGAGAFFAPGMHGQMMFKLDSSDGQTRNMKIIRDGKSIEVNQDADGRIVVRRGSVDDDSAVTEQEYESEEALQNGDEEAYELYKQFAHGGGAYTVVTPDANFHFELKQEISEALEKAHEAMEDAGALSDDARAQLEDQLRSFHVRTPNAWQNWPNVYRFEAFAGEPKTSYKLEADGSIVVTTRDGDAVLTRTYKDAEDLKSRDPKRYQKFKALQDAE